MTLGVTVASRFAEALLLRGRNRSISFAIVEGATDSRVYKRVFNSDSTHILWLNGKDDALNLANKFQEASIPGTIAVIDSDLDRYYGRPRQSASVVWTSENDMEVMVLRSDAYLRTIPNAPRYDTMIRNRDRLFAAAIPLATVRLLSNRNDWGLDFKELVFSAFIDTAAITCSIDAMCEEVIYRNPQFEIDAQALAEEVTDFLHTLHNPSLVYHGHDLCKMLTMCTMRLFSGRDIRFEQISRKYEPDDFKSTSTWEEITQWEVDNAPFCVLPNV